MIYDTNNNTNSKNNDHIVPDMAQLLWAFTQFIW